MIKPNELLDFYSNALLEVYSFYLTLVQFPTMDWSHQYRIIMQKYGGVIQGIISFLQQENIIIFNNAGELLSVNLIDSKYIIDLSTKYFKGIDQEQLLPSIKTIYPKHEWQQNFPQTTFFQPLKKPDSLTSEPCKPAIFVNDLEATKKKQQESQPRLRVKDADDYVTVIVKLHEYYKKNKFYVYNLADICELSGWKKITNGTSRSNSIKVLHRLNGFLIENKIIKQPHARLDSIRVIKLNLPSREELKVAYEAYDKGLTKRNPLKRSEAIDLLCHLDNFGKSTHSSQDTPPAKR